MTIDDIEIDTITIVGRYHLSDDKNIEFCFNSKSLSDETMKLIFNDLERGYE